jgi:hypothetical protein
MNNLIFCVPHHCGMPMHTYILTQCIKSIRKFHPESKIIICKTSGSVVPEELLDEYITVCNTPVDNSHIYGAMKLISDMKIEDHYLRPEGAVVLDHYLFMHDSMILLKPLPSSILEKKFCYLWHFDNYGFDYKHEIIDMIMQLDSNLTIHSNTAELLNVYFNGFPYQWKGLFGPAFGCNLDSLNKIIEATPFIFNHLDKCPTRPHIMIAERFVGYLAQVLGLLDSSDNSVNGSIFDLPEGFNTCSSIEDVDRKLALPYEGYMMKLWLLRN